MKTNAVLPLTVLSLFTLACDIDKPGNLADVTATTGDPASTTTDEPTGGGTSDPTVAPTTGDDPSDTDSTGEPLAPATGVDVLFVVDNSGSMASVQQRLAQGIDAFVDPIVAAGLDLRIAVTTTDSGNPRCQGTTPESGALLVESCRARVAAGEYVTAEGDFSAACLDVCPHDAIATLPTATDADPVATPRPWIEWSAGATNLDVPLGEALSCAIPQGIVGCGFEQPLESLHRAIDRMRSPDDPAAGFLRPNAHFVAIVLTDETDCSYNPEFDEIFIDNKTYWWSPDDPAPTSSMCWDAGITCSGGPGTYDDCVATDRDKGGNLTDNGAAAVLRPVSRYHDALVAVAADKQAAGSAAQVQVVVVGGVPIGWPDNPQVFADSPDPDYMSKFGIGPGCTNMDMSTAVPPGRLRELAEQHAPLVQPMFSICQPNFAGLLAVIAAGVVQ